MPAVRFEGLTKVYGSGDTAVIGIQDLSLIHISEPTRH